MGGFRKGVNGREAGSSGGSAGGWQPPALFLCSAWGGGGLQGPSMQGVGSQQCPYPMREGGDGSSEQPPPSSHLMPCFLPAVCKQWERRPGSVVEFAISK